MPLFRCEVSLTYYCIADDEASACDLATDAASDRYMPECVDAIDITSEDKLLLLDGWTKDALVYGSKKDLKLGDAWNKRHELCLST